MKKLIFFIVLFSLIGSNKVFSEDFYLKIYYLSGEKSKDSYAIEELMTVNGLDGGYSVKYDGKKSKYDIDTEKVCTITENDIDKIKKTIVDKGLNANDSMFEKETKMKSYEIYCNINIDIKMGENSYRIRINGDTSEFKNKVLFLHALILIMEVRDILLHC